MKCLSDAVTRRRDDPINLTIEGGQLIGRHSLTGDSLISKPINA